jgi:hypothetical protein
MYPEFFIVAIIQMMSMKNASIILVIITIFAQTAA